MEQVTNQVENQELTQEQVSSHEQAMVAKADGASEASLEKDGDQFSETNGDETLLAGKYKTQEDLERAYKELEAKLGTKEEEVIEEVKDVPQTPVEAEKLVTEKGIDFAELNTEFASSGELSEDTYSNLAAKGIERNTVDAYIAGQEALAQQNVGKLQASVGGEGEFNAMIEWATDNLSDSERQGFNTAVESEAMAEFAIKGLHARYKAQAAPNLIEGGTGTAGASRGYSSAREMTREMADPRYKNDPGFRKMVESKITRSSY